MKALVVGALLVLASCSGSASEITGRVLEVHGDLESVSGFTLITESGDRLVFVTPAEADRFEFPLVHLRDHLLSAEPVVVAYQTSAGALVVLRIDDAP